MHYTKIKQIEKGWSSFIFLVKDEQGREYVMKQVRTKSPRQNLYEREGEMLKLANSVGVGPRLVEVNQQENYVIYHYVKGIEFLAWLNTKEFASVSAEQFYDFIKELYRQVLRLDTVHLSHNQLSGGRNILVTEQKNWKGETEYIPTIIDFETAKVKDAHQKTKNLGQLDDYFFYNKFGFAARKVREKLNVTL